MPTSCFNICKMGVPTDLVSHGVWEIVRDSECWCLDLCVSDSFKMGYARLNMWSGGEHTVNGHIMAKKPTPRLCFSTMSNRVGRLKDSEDRGRTKLPQAC